MAASTDRLRGVVVGAGYFSQYHFDAWRRMTDAELTAVCDTDEPRARAASLTHGVPRVYQDAQAMFDAERPDFVDIITGPASHLELCRLAADRGIAVLCQKPLAPTYDEATALVETAARAGIRLMAHDNFRFQPWHRELRKLCNAGAIGTLHSIACRTRTGDGWGPDAYRARQPYFRTMPRLLIFETGVHIIDVFRYLGGEIRRVFATLRRLNPEIAGEDCGVVLFDFHNGATGLWDANRYNESLNRDPRFTFGEFVIEGTAGSLRVDEDGGILVHALGQPPSRHEYPHERRGFAGDCCYAAIRHFVECLRSGAAFETDGREYLKTLAVQEAVYASSASGTQVVVADLGLR
jgi:predicted dehydrogenase